MFLWVSGWREVSGFTLEVVVGTEGGGIGLFEGSRLYCRFLLFTTPRPPFKGALVAALLCSYVLLLGLFVNGQ